MAATRATMSSRRRPLHTCASSMLGIIDTAYRRSQQLNGPLGNFIKRLAVSVKPNIPYASKVQHLGLTVLSLTDDHILFFERITESVFPLSGLVFDKIDLIVYSAEGLPRRFDEALNNIPTMMHQIPFLDWVLMHVIWWLNFLVSSLSHWGSSRHPKEKEIMIDKGFDPCNSPMIESPTKTTDSSGEGAQERSVLLIESPVKGQGQSMVSSNESVESGKDKEICDEAARGQSIVASNEFVESAEARGESMASNNEFVESSDKEIVDQARDQSMGVGSNESVESIDKEGLFYEARGQSMVASNEPVESIDKEGFYEAQGDQSMVASNEPVESIDKEGFVEAHGDQSMVDSNEPRVESIDKEGFDEAQGGQSMVDSNEFVDSLDKENVDEARGQSSMVVGSNNEFVESPNSVETQEKSMLSDSEEPSSLMHHEKSGENKSKTEESEKKTDQDDQENEDQDQTETYATSTTTLSPAESFQSAQFEHIVSPSATNDSFHEAKSFENIDSTTTDEDETKEKSLPAGKGKSTSSMSSGKKNKAKRKKGTEKDEKKDENKVEDQHKILELLEAKWHMM